MGEGLPYREKLPVVYYGSSITQGACASRPGNAYQNTVSRHMNLDHINLGFSGSGRAEDAVVDYMASLPMLAFVSDYDHNAPNEEYLLVTNQKLYDAIRAKHPEIPYIMISAPDFDNGLKSRRLRRDAILKTLAHARANGDENVWFIDGASLSRGLDEDSCSVDNTHPNDFGFSRFAEKVEAELRHALMHDIFDN